MEYLTEAGLGWAMCSSVVGIIIGLFMGFRLVAWDQRWRRKKRERKQ